MKENNDNESSARESGYENFDWIQDTNFPKKMKKFFTEYPLNRWKDIILNSNDMQIRNDGLYYQGTVNKILKKDIFLDFDFHEDKSGAMDFNFNKTYDIDYSQLSRKTISPDFYVYKIENKKFFELLKTREYMMILKYANEIPETAKFISILGEIKSSYSYCHVLDRQRQDYDKFINLVNESKTDEYIILMYIYDSSFHFFQKDYYYNTKEENPTIYGYIPKLYYEDCYQSYNILIEELKLQKEKIDISVKTSFKKKRKELEKENALLIQENNSLKQQLKKENVLPTQNNNSLKEKLEKENALLIQENNLLKQQNEKLLKPSWKNTIVSSLLFSFISIIFVLIFAYLLNKFKLINFNNN